MGETAGGAGLKTVALDAMGVIYPVGDDGDDVKNLLIPFIKEKGGSEDIENIERLYLQASLGKLPAFQFWQKVGLNPKLEDEYLKRFSLAPGLIGFLEAANSRKVAVWCLSNDISEWSRKLRENFALNKYMRGFIISGDIKARKPDIAIFKYLLKLTGGEAADITMVDDRPANLEAASSLGYNTVLFNSAGHGLSQKKHRTAVGFKELMNILL
ncbi:MAG: HAD-IA family hydrolase [Dehalococcoidia bacterium]|nr:HAD-IA family hydrolase [Dehalococcoidia bacterium]